MTCKTLIPIAAAVALCAPLPVMAQSKRSGPRCMPTHVKKQLATYDVNKNGKLEPAEHHAMREARRKADLAKYDKDNSGRLEGAERKALRWDRLVQHFGELDTDKSGTITRAEAKGSCTPVERHFSRIDRDNNGSITWTEFESAAPKRFPPPHGRHRHPPRP